MNCIEILEKLVARESTNPGVLEEGVAEDILALLKDAVSELYFREKLRDASVLFATWIRCLSVCIGRKIHSESGRETDCMVEAPAI